MTKQSKHLDFPKKPNSFDKVQIILNYQYQYLINNKFIYSPKNNNYDDYYDGYDANDA